MGAAINCLVSDILQNVFFWVKQKKLLQVWNNLRVSKMMTEFWIKYPFKQCLFLLTAS